MHVLYHVIILDLEILHAIYGKWAMAPSCITKRLLPQVIYPLLHKRLANKQSPFFLTRKEFFFLFFLHVPIYFSNIFSFPDGSEEEGVAQPLSKEEEEVEVMRSWIEVGGFLAQQEEEAKGLLSEVGLSSCPSFSFFFLLSSLH